MAGPARFDQPVRHSPSTEDYVRTIYKLTEVDAGRAPAVSTGALAARLGVGASACSGMIRKLGDAGLVEHPPYGDIALSADGRTLALDVVRRHRVLELYLVRELGYSWDEVDSDAEVLEHAVSARMLERMEDKLGHPTVDPHGDPIPGRDGTLSRPVLIPLAELATGGTGLVARVLDDDPDLLRYLSGRALVLGSRIEVLGREPFDGTMTVRVDDGRGELALGHRVARAVLIDSDG